MKKNKKIISIILTSIMILSIVASSLVSTFSSYAADSVSFVSLYSISTDDIILGSELDIYHNSQYFIPSTDSQMYTNVTNVINGGMSVNYAPIMSLIPSVEDYPCYILTYVNGYVDFLALPEGSFIGVLDSGIPYVYSPKGYFTEHNRILSFQFNNDGSYHAYYDFDYSSYLNSNVNVDFGDYGVVGVVVNDASVYCSNIPIYDANSNVPSDLSNLDYETQYNPSIDSDNNTETSINNLYFLTADVTYDIGDLNGGNVSCWGKLNEYVNAHPDKFTFHYKYVFNIDVANNVVTGKKIQNSAVGTQTYDMPMEDFVSNGCAAYKSLADIERAATFTNVQSNLGYTSIRDVVEYFYESDGTRDSWNPQWYTFTLTTSFWFTDEDGNSSNWYTETYNFLNGSSTVDSDGITNNKYPFSLGTSNNDLSGDDVLNNGDGVSNEDIPSSNNGTSGNVNVNVGGSSTGAINITNNNNAYGGSSSSSSVSASDSNGFGSFLSTLISLLSNGQESSSETISSMADSNGWMTVANTSLSAVPESLWTTLLTTFAVCITISIVACVISLLLKIFF